MKFWRNCYPALSDASNLRNLAFLGVLVLISYPLLKFAARGIFEITYLSCLMFIILVFIKPSWYICVLLFIIIFPMGPILPSKSLLLPGVDIVELISLMVVVNYFLIYKKFDFNLNKIQKLSIILSFFFLVIFMNTLLIKHYLIWGLWGLDFTKLIIMTGKNIFYFICIALIISKSSDPRINLIIKSGLIIGILIYSTSIFFGTSLAKLGFAVHLEDKIQVLDQDFFKARHVGLIQGGPDVLGHYLSVGFGYFISLLERKKKLLYFLGAATALAGVLITASRAGLIAIVIITAIYLWGNFRKNPFSLVLILTIFLSSHFIYGKFMEKRVANLKSEISVEKNPRLSRQSLYLNDFRQYPYFLLVGTMKKTRVSLRNPHNKYMEMAYWGGLPYILCFIILMFKIGKVGRQNEKSKYSYSILYPLVGFIIPYFASSSSFIMYFPLILAISNEMFGEIKRRRLNHCGTRKYYHARR